MQKSTRPHMQDGMRRCALCAGNLVARVNPRQLLPFRRQPIRLVLRPHRIHYLIYTGTEARRSDASFRTGYCCSNSVSSSSVSGRVVPSSSTCATAAAADAVDRGR